MSKPYRPAPGTPIEELETPCLLLDLDALEHNIGVIAKLYRDASCKLRPHVKNHKSPQIAHMQLRAGGTVGGVCAAKVSEAEVMVQAGISNVLIANQVVGYEKLARLASLALRAEILVACDNVQNASDVSGAGQAPPPQIWVLIEVNTSMGRAGSRSQEDAVALAQHISSLPGLRFQGVMSHQIIDGAPDRETRFTKGRADMQVVLAVKAAIERAGLQVETVSTGETWCYDVAPTVPGVTEVQAGSYALLDTSYAYMTEFRIAAKVLGTVTSIPRPGFATGDVSIEAMASPKGMPSIETPAGLRVTRLTYEQSFLEFDEGVALKPGDRYTLCPAQEDMMVNRWDQYIAVRNGKVEDVWDIAARGMIH
jgi:D-serine deaminase-like pyridoxal phosphate-dependent protein